MNPILFISFLIPASVAFALIVLLIKERRNYIPHNQFRQPHRSGEAPEERFLTNRDQHPHDFLDLSGGTMGI